MDAGYPEITVGRPDASPPRGYTGLNTVTCPGASVAGARRLAQLRTRRAAHLMCRLRPRRPWGAVSKGW